MPLICTENLTRIYRPGQGEVKALSGVSLSIEAGEMAAVTGDSGSGKTTLMNLLGCMDRPSAGRYWLDGQDVSRLSDAELARIRNRRIGFVFQRFHLIPSMTALENAALPLVYRGRSAAQRAEAAAEALRRVGLGDRMDHRPCELSGGQQQRTAIARALAGDPQLLLADEPTGNLDRDSADAVMALFESLHREGRTLLLITHDPLIAARCKRVITIRAGRIAADSGGVYCTPGGRL